MPASARVEQGTGTVVLHVPVKDVSVNLLSDALAHVIAADLGVRFPYWN